MHKNLLLFFLFLFWFVLIHQVVIKQQDNPKKSLDRNLVDKGCNYNEDTARCIIRDKVTKEFLRPRGGYQIGKSLNYSKCVTWLAHGVPGILFDGSTNDGKDEWYYAKNPEHMKKLADMVLDDAKRTEKIQTKCLILYVCNSAYKSDSVEISIVEGLSKALPGWDIKGTETVLEINDLGKAEALYQSGTKEVRKLYPSKEFLKKYK